MDEGVDDDQGKTHQTACTAGNDMESIILQEHNRIAGIVSMVVLQEHNHTHACY